MLRLDKWQQEMEEVRNDTSWPQLAFTSVELSIFVGAKGAAHALGRSAEEIWWVQALPREEGGSAKKADRAPGSPWPLQVGEEEGKMKFNRGFPLEDSDSGEL